MSLTNPTPKDAANEAAIAAFAAELNPAPADRFDAMSDRELMLTIARNMSAVTEMVEQVATQVAPLMNSPMFGMLGKFIR